MPIVLSLVGTNIRAQFPADGIESDFHLLRSGEHNHKVAAVIALATVNIAHTEFGVVGAEDVGGVWAAVHPPVKSGLWILGDHVVLANPRECVALHCHSIPNA